MDTSTSEDRLVKHEEEKHQIGPLVKSLTGGTQWSQSKNSRTCCGCRARRAYGVSLLQFSE